MKTIELKAACWLAAALVASTQSAFAVDSPALDLVRQLNEAFVEVAAQVTPSVVVVDIRQRVNDNDSTDSGSFWDLLPPEYRRRFQHHGSSTPQHWLEGEGSGIIVSADGYILTNNHVVENADVIEIRLNDGRKFTGKVKGVDPESDIAIVKIDATGLKPAKLGNSDDARVGEFVLAIGAPFELNDTVTVGHISAKGRVFQNQADQDFIQTDTKILPGNSGGPLVNLYGEVIGINTMIEGLDTGIGFAVPMNIAKRVKDHLISDGKFTRSWLGIGIDELKNQGDYLGLSGPLAPGTRDGVLVTAIMPDGPASKSDLQPGDVVTAVDGKSVQTVRQLRDEISVKKAGRMAVLNVVRGNVRLTVKVAPGVMPSNGGLSIHEHHALEPVEPAVALGLTVQDLTRDLAQQFGVTAASGVLVTAVEEGSPAATQGIKVGDVVTAVNRQAVSTLRQFRDFLSSADTKHGLMINFVSAGESRFLVLKDIGGNSP